MVYVDVQIQSVFGPEMSAKKSRAFTNEMSLTSLDCN